MFLLLFSRLQAPQTSKCLRWLTSTPQLSSGGCPHCFHLSAGPSDLLLENGFRSLPAATGWKPGLCAPALDRKLRLVRAALRSCSPAGHARGSWPAAAWLSSRGSARPGPLQTQAGVRSGSLPTVAYRRPLKRSARRYGKSYGREAVPGFLV